MMDLAKANEIVNSLTVDDILTAYSGKPGCACGCNGKYVVTQQSRAEAETDRGYAYDDEEVNPKQVKRVLKQVQKHAALGGPAPFVNLNKHDEEVFWNVADDLQYITYQAHENRVYTVYLTSAARRARGITEGYDLR